MNMKSINMGINETYAETIKLHYKKNKTSQESEKLHAARKENPALDRMLYESDKADLLKEMSEAKNLLLKIARGDSLTEEEKKFLKEKYPEEADKAKRAKEQAEEIKERLKNAKTKEERQSIVMQAYGMVENAGETDPVYAEALSEGIKKVLSEARKEETVTFYETSQDKLFSRYQDRKEGISLFDNKY